MTVHRRGFILATTLLVMTLLTVMLVATFVTISAEFRTTNASFSTARALNLAQAGLQNYFAYGHSLGAGSDSMNYGFPGGYARVVARRLRDSTATERALWIVYSTGLDTTRSLVVQGTGQRVVGQLAYLSPGTLPARAAMVAANGVVMQGPAASGNPINGRNLGFSLQGCTIPSGAAADTVGLTTFGGGYQSGAGPGPSSWPREQLAVRAAVNDSTRIDWGKLLGGEFTPDYVNTYPPAGNSTYQTHYFTSDATIPIGQRRGLLVVTGDVTLLSGAHWDGIIVAGGRLNTPPGNNPPYTIHGTIITGLNISLGRSVNANQVTRSSNAEIRWDWCYTRASMGALTYLVPIRGTYGDTWKTY